MVRASRICRHPNRPPCLNASAIRVSSVVCWVVLVSLTGCQSWMSKSKEKDNQFLQDSKRFKEMLKDPERPRLVGEVAAALGLSSKSYDAFGLATDLPGTGGIVKPGTQRDLILADMRLRNVESPEAVLDALWSALVKLKVYANPCDQKGDIMDVAVEVSTECLATDLTGGFVLDSRLREMVNINGTMRTSDDKAYASGDIVILPSNATRNQESTPLKGILIGGGRLIEEQRLGLQIDPEFRHVIVTKAIEKSINLRFFFQDSNKQRLVAEGKNDSYIVIETVPKYKYDPSHFMSVILATGFGESDEERKERVNGCKKLLANRDTARRAAVELESIGDSAAQEVLISGLESSDIEIRFHSAYSLAYLNRKEAIPTLMELARYEPAMRPLCLIGLSMNEDSMAREALEELLQEREPELRFGAFWAIRHRNPTDLAVSGEMIGQDFQFVQIPSAIPLMAVSLQTKKEIVLFGNSIGVELRSPLSPTPALKITPVMGDQLKMTKRKTSGEVFNTIVASDVVSILRGMANIQASYNDVVHTLNRLSNAKALATPLALNPRPSAGREYVRKSPLNASSDVESKLNIVSIDNSSVKKLVSTSFGWITPTSWWKKPQQSTVKKSLPKEPPAESSLELSDEERALLNN